MIIPIIKQLMMGLERIYFVCLPPNRQAHLYSRSKSPAFVMMLPLCEMIYSSMSVCCTDTLYCQQRQPACSISVSTSMQRCAYKHYYVVSHCDARVEVLGNGLINVQLLDGSCDMEPTVILSVLSD